MKTFKLFIIVALFSSLFSNSQITKGNWMVGGTGSFSSNQYENSNNNNVVKSKSSGFNISPNLGYFVIDKLALGSAVGFNTSNPSGDNNNSTGFSFGPFARYYILEKEKNYNIFTQFGYSISSSKNETGYKSNSKGYGLKAGPVIYFNSSVGLEFAFEYYLSKNNEDAKYSGFQFGLGLQIHLEK